MPSVLVDAGPLVALIDRSDPHHQDCREALAGIDDSLGTVWPAFTEAMYLLRTQPERSARCGTCWVWAEFSSWNSALTIARACAS